MLSKSKGNRSVSCLKNKGGSSSSNNSSNLEFNSYASARRKMREFKERLSSAVEEPSKYKKTEIVDIL